MITVFHVCYSDKHFVNSSPDKQYFISERNCSSNASILVLIAFKVKPRKIDIRLFRILANSKSIWDTLDSKNSSYS